MAARPIDFKSLNKFGQLVPLDNVERVNEFQVCIDNIRDYFQFPCYYNGLLLHYLLLDTRNCQNDTLENKRHLELAQDVIFAIIQNDDVTPSGRFLSVLCDTLTKMIHLSSVKIAPIEPKSSLSGGVMEVEWKWWNWCTDMFQHVYDTFAPSYDSVRKQIAIVSGDFSEMQDLTRESRNMFHMRFQIILDQLTQTQVSRKVRLTMASKNYQYALLVNLGRFNSLSSLKAQIQHYVGNLVPVIGIDGMPPADCIDQILGPGGQLDMEQIHNLKYRIRKMATFLRRKDIYIVTMLLTLLNDTKDNMVDRIHHKFTDLLLARLKQCPEYAEVDPVLVWSDFCKDLEAFGNFMKKYLQF